MDLNRRPSAEQSLASLQQIADALGVPIDSFFDQTASEECSPGEAAVREAAELLEAFLLITDEQARRNCIEFIRRRGTRV